MLKPEDYMRDLMATHAVLQRIANGRKTVSSGKTTHLRLHEAIDLARVECERLGLPYDERSVGILPSTTHSET
jgi:hypothetical protein